MAHSNATLCLPRPSSGLNTKVPAIVTSELPSAALPPNHVLIRVERFGFSQNNVTYQSLGEHPHFRYFDFHAAPTGDAISANTHGLVPVWGFGTIQASTHPKIQQGERVYGYLAPSQFLLVPVSPNDVNKHAFYVPRPHLPPDRRPYNQILRCSADPQYTPTTLGEELTMIYRPLFWTSFWCEDWLALSGFRGASSILISSASSKTAFCLAYLVGLRKQQGGSANVPTSIIALTSKRNKNFTQGLGLYTHVLDYDSFTSDSVLKSGKVLYVDVNGNTQLNKKIFDFLALPSSSQLVGSIGLGYTSLAPTSASAELEWKTKGPADPSSIATAPPSTIEQFFMVEWLDKRKNQLTLNEIFNRQQTAWDRLIKDCVPWLKLERVYGPDAVVKAYAKIVGGDLGPETGYVWSMWDNVDPVEKAKL